MLDCGPCVTIPVQCTFLNENLFVDDDQFIHVKTVQWLERFSVVHRVVGSIPELGGKFVNPAL